MKDGIRRMVERKDYRSVHMLFPFVVVFVDLYTGHDKEAPITTIKTWYADILTKIDDDCGSTGWTEKDNDELSKEKYCFNNLLFEFCILQCPIALHNLTLQVLHHLREDL